jgi:subtilase family serine protease
MATMKRLAMLVAVSLLVLGAGAPAFADLQNGVTIPEQANYNATPITHVVHSGFITATPFLNPLTYCGGFICYSPAFLISAYDFPSGLTGAGQTIVIVAAYGSPTIQTDLGSFDQSFGIAAPPSFTVFCAPRCPNVNFKGSSTTVNAETSWSIEATLDVEYAHAMAPGANLVLAVALSGAVDDLNNALGLAVAAYPGSVISLSWGTPESQLSSSQVNTAESSLQSAANTGVTVIAAAGDEGATNGGSTISTNFPASSPLVTSVGGTMGNPYPNGLAAVNCQPSGDCSPSGYGGEQVWNEANENGAGGGGPSSLFAVPTYQAGLGLTSRAVPDVSYNAADNGGVLIIWSACPSCINQPPGPVTLVAGGTSAAAPQWAAIVAIVNQYSVQNGGHVLGSINSALYSVAQSSSYLSAFHDVTSGNNRYEANPLGYNATSGYDLASGWGTPNVANLVPDLVAAAGQ